MTFAGDGWICRACWNSNRWQDKRCYRCKVQRGADHATVQEYRARREAKLKQEAVPSGLVTTIPSTVMRWYARLILVLGIVPLVLFALLALGFAREQLPAIAALVGIHLAVWWTFRWAAGAMESGNRLAFVVTALVSWSAAAGLSTALRAIPEGVALDTLGQLIVGILSIVAVTLGLSGLLAAIGFVLRLIPGHWLPSERA